MKVNILKLGGKNKISNCIEIQNLVKYFKNVKAVNGISLNIKEGELFGILGPNGAGKTTLIRMITTTLTPSSGDAKIKEFSIKNQKKEIVKLIGVCPQENVFYNELTAEENVIFVAQMHGIPMENSKKKAEAILTKLGIAGKKRWAKKFSGGMKKRLNLAMSLVNDPKILILDEPTAGLDPQARRIVWDLIRNLKGKGNTIILLTHDMLEADTLSDHIAIIDNGKIIANGTPAELKEEHGGENILEISFYNESDVVIMIKQMKEISFVQNWKEFGEKTLFIPFKGGMKNYLKILQKMSEKINDVENMKFRQNSLEDVFLNLTGRRLRD